MLRLIVGLVIVAVDAAIPWLLRRAPKVLLAGAAAACLIVMLAGVSVMLPRFVPFLVLLAVLSVLDLTQPGLLGLALAELVANTIGKQPSSALAPVTQALIPYPTVGWLATELLLRREYRTGSNRLS